MSSTPERSTHPTPPNAPERPAPPQEPITYKEYCARCIGWKDMFEEWKADHSTMDSDDSDEAFEQFLFQLDTVHHTELYRIAEMIEEAYRLEDEEFMFNEAEDEKDDPLAMMMQLAVKPAANKSHAEVDCNFGAACNRPDCWFRHSKSTVTAAPAASAVECKFGANCHFGARCRNSHSTTAVTAAPPAASSTPCKFGANCHFGPRCRNSHSTPPVVAAPPVVAHPRDAGGAGSA